MSEEVYHCYMSSIEEIQLRREPLTINSKRDWKTIKYVGTLSRDYYDANTLFKPSAIVVDVKRKEILPTSLVSFPTKESLGYALTGSEIIEGLTGNYLLLLPITIKE